MVNGAFRRITDKTFGLIYEGTYLRIMKIRLGYSELVNRAGSSLLAHCWSVKTKIEDKNGRQKLEE